MQGEIKRGAFARLALDLEPAAVKLDDPLHECKTNPRAFGGRIEEYPLLCLQCEQRLFFDQCLFDLTKNIIRIDIGSSILDHDV